MHGGRGRGDVPGEVSVKGLIFMERVKQSGSWEEWEGVPTPWWSHQYPSPLSLFCPQNAVSSANRKITKKAVNQYEQFMQKQVCLPGLWAGIEGNIQGCDGSGP